MQTKVCSSCGQNKVLDEFSRNPSRKDGFSNQCKLCHQLYSGFNKRHIATEFLPKFKICNKCKQLLPQDKFNFHTTSPDGLQSFCKQCTVLNRRGVSKLIYEQLLEKQNYLCAICGKPETSKNSVGLVQQLSVDHDHRTGKIRGLLCCHCNHLLGSAKDDTQVLRKAIDYLCKNQ
jgi:RNA polymerase subunit RPABC4/transcription elongation factor Spt4